jgi:hypothetical protein
MTTELRDYRIVPGHLDEFVAAWRAGVVPLRVAHGFRIDAAWTTPGEDRFTWLLSKDVTVEEFRAHDAAYYADPARADLQPDPAIWIRDADTRFVKRVPSRAEG